MDVDEVWKQYRNRLKAFLHSRVSNPADVDDLLQDISIKTLTGFASIEDQTKVQSWLFQTANRTIIDFYRKDRNSRDISSEDLWYSKDDPVVINELERCVEPFLAALPDDTRELLTAIDLEGKSQKQYAAATGISYSTLKSRVQKGRAALRSVFEDCCHMHGIICWLA